MIATAIVKQSLEQKKKNTLIFASQLYREEFQEMISKQSFYAALERLVESNELCKAARDIYYVPLESRFGVVPISEREVVGAFTAQNTGMEIGYSLYRKINITTQVSKAVELYSSRIWNETEQIGNVVIKRANLSFSPKMKTLIAGMEVMQNYYEIQDLGISGFVNLANEFANVFEQEMFDDLIRHIKYKESTVAFAESVLNHFGKKNNLHQYLSFLSNYHHPDTEIV